MVMTRTGCHPKRQQEQDMTDKPTHTGACPACDAIVDVVSDKPDAETVKCQCPVCGFAPVIFRKLEAKP
jgi:hypothetical protein